MKITRRELIQSSLALTAGVSLPGFLRAETLSIPREIKDSDRIPLKGEEFNESFIFPDEKTVWLFRERITREGLVENIFEDFNRDIELKGLIMHEGKM